MLGSLIMARPYHVRVKKKVTPKTGQDDRPSRSEAMRRLIKLALASQGRRRGMMIRLWFAVLLLFVATAHADPIASQDIYIIDGDTIAVHGKTIRLVGFDAPELGGHAHCGIERMLAARATSRLRQMRPIGVKPEGRKVDRMAAQSAKIEQHETGKPLHIKGLDRSIRSWTHLGPIYGPGGSL